MSIIPIEEAQRHLSEILEKLPVGEEVILTRNHTAIATLRAMAVKPGKTRQFGTLKGSVISIGGDFDEIPEGFEDYLP